MGARQIGKTFIVEEIGKKEYKNFIEINFEQRPELKRIFDGDLSVDEMIKKYPSSFLMYNSQKEKHYSYWTRYSLALRRELP